MEWHWTLCHKDTVDTKQSTVCVSNSEKPNPLSHILLQSSWIFLQAGNYVDKSSRISCIKYFLRSTLTMTVLVLKVGVEKCCSVNMMTKLSWPPDIWELDQGVYGTRLSRSHPTPSFLSPWRTSRLPSCYTGTSKLTLCKLFFCRDWLRQKLL